jgi:hypothetical protein
MARPKFSKDELKAVKEKIADKVLWGTPLADIAQELGITIQTVSYHHLRIKQEQRAILRKHKDARELLVAEKFFQYEAQIRENYAAWKRSQEDHVKVTEETITSAAGEVSEKKSESREGQSGDARFQSLIKQCRDAQRELLGLDAPKQTENKNLNINCNWDAFAESPALQPPKDIVEEAISRTESGEVIEEIAPPEDPEELPEGELDYGLKELPPSSRETNGTIDHPP